MSLPLIQINEHGESREMTEEEFASYLDFWSQIKTVTEQSANE
jgi:hypothetical protein